MQRDLVGLLDPHDGDRLQDPDLTDRGCELIEGFLVEPDPRLLFVGLDVIDRQHGKPRVVIRMLGRDQRLEPPSQSPASLTHRFNPLVRAAPGIPV